MSSSPEKKPAPTKVNKGKQMEAELRLEQKKQLVFLNNKEYLEKNPEIKGLLSAFMSSLLLNKPENVAEFTMNYFTPFLHASN
jgi:hypothetical protein